MRLGGSHSYFRRKQCQCQEISVDASRLGRTGQRTCFNGEYICQEMAPTLLHYDMKNRECVGREIACVPQLGLTRLNNHVPNENDSQLNCPRHNTFLQGEYPCHVIRVDSSRLDCYRQRMCFAEQAPCDIPLGSQSRIQCPTARK